MKKVLLYLVSSLPGLVSSIPCWILYALYGQNLRWEDGALMWEFKKGAAPLKTWYRGWGGTTFGLMMMLKPKPSKKLRMHELVHVEQFQAGSLLGLMVALCVLLFSQAMLLALAVWAFLPGLHYVCAGVVAVLRGESFYRGNVLEEAAYAVAMKETEKLSCTKAPVAWIDLNSK